MKRRSTLALILATALLLASFTAWSDSGASSRAPSGAGTAAGTSSAASAAESGKLPAPGSGDKDYNIVYIPKSVHEFYNMVLDGVNTGIKELDGKGIKVHLTWSAAPTADSAKQAELLESAISLKPDAIAIAVIDGEMCKDLMQEAVDKGILVIAFDTDFNGSPRLACVGAGMDNQYLCGANLVDMLIKGMGTDEAKIALLTGSPSAENHKIIVKGVQDYIAKSHPKLQIVATQADNDNLETATQLTENILSQHPDVKGIIGVTSSDGLGAGKAFEAAVSAGKYKPGDVTIVDKTLTAEKKGTMIPNGYMYGVQDCPPTLMGYYSIMMLNAYLTDGVPFQDVYLKYQAATKDNLDTFATDYRKQYESMEYWNKK